jgi:hypothetical protein
MRSTRLCLSARFEPVERRLMFNGGDLDPPAVSSIVFDFDTPGVKPSITISFSEPVQPTTFDTTAGSSFKIVDRATNLPISPGNFALANSSGTASIITFKGGVGAPANGDFRITVNAGNVSDLAGNSLGSSSSLDYFFMQCDASRDRKVNTSDFNQLAGNFGNGGRRFSQGDFSFDGNIDSVDFLFLRSLYGWKLSATPPAVSVFSAASPGKSIAEDLFS